MRYEKKIRNLIFVFTILALSLPGFPEDKIVASQWADAPVKIDGLNSDWDTQVLNSDKRTSVDYAFRNDADNLYVLVTFKDPKFLSSINFTGMTIWFNSEASKKKDFAIRFVNMPITADQYIAILEKKTGAVSDEQKAQIRTNERYMYYDYELINKTSKEAPSQFTETQGLKMPVFKNNVLEKTVTYEFSVPLKRLAELSAGIGADPGSTIQICFEWGGATKGMKDAVAAQIGAEGARAKPEGATGELTEEREYGDMGGEGLAAMRRRLPKQYLFWATVKLAQSQ